ncbi:solute carrier family 20 [Hyaloraphidium curvatum]|nr:solute carrier family 20 [Hyaloraphidium curvatum]
MSQPPAVCPDGLPPNPLSTMPPQGYTYIFVCGLFVAFADAYAIGANDVANSFSTAVASKTITLRQAVYIAVVAEFLGAFLLGKSTAETIKSGIADLNNFKDEPEMLMLGMFCALVRLPRPLFGPDLMVCRQIGSATTVITATRFGLPVSTTHSLVGGIIGMSVAIAGWNSVQWGLDGMLKIVISWFSAPIFAGVLAAGIYLSVKYLVLASDNAFERGLQFLPLYFFIAVGIMIEYIIFKGMPNLPKPENMPQWQLLACIFGGLGGAALLALFAHFFYVPWIRRVLMNNEDLKFWHIPVIHCTPEQPKATSASTPWGQERLEAERKAKELEEGAEKTDANGKEEEVVPEAIVTQRSLLRQVTGETPTLIRSGTAAQAVVRTTTVRRTLTGYNDPVADQLAAQMYANEGIPIPDNVEVRPIIPWKQWGNAVKDRIMWGMNQEIANHDNEKYAYLHDVAVVYDSKAEELYSFLQVFTCSLASFAHGSNDVANAIGPLATIYSIWSVGGYCIRLTKSSPIELWTLAFGGAAISIGLATWGYNVMRTLGNHLTYHSPSRGFSMELGASFAVLTASFIGIPVSSTQCITGATAAVGLCNGTTKGLNWKLLGWCFISWFLTVPLSACISGGITGFIINAPQWNWYLLE